MSKLLEFGWLWRPLWIRRVLVGPNKPACGSSHIPCQFFPEERPDETADALRRFFG
jgi:hypothetical protein